MCKSVSCVFTLAFVLKPPLGVYLIFYVLATFPPSSLPVLHVVIVDLTTEDYYSLLPVLLQYKLQYAILRQRTVIL